MNEIVSFVSANPVAVLTDEAKYSEFYRAIKAEIAAFIPDVSTERGRKDIASLAYKVTRSKTAIDAAGKKLNEEARAKINIVDASRRKIRDELDALADEVRKPLTDWENAEDARKEEAASDLKKIADLSIVLASDTATEIKSKWDAINLIILRDDVHLDGIDHARSSLESALDGLEAARARAQKAEDDQKELARLRAEQESREIAENEKRRAEAEAKRQIEAEDLLANQVLEYIKNVRAGMIGGSPYPYGILLRELEIKIPLEEYADRHHQRIAEAKKEAHEYLTAQMERDRAVTAEREAAESKAREEAAAQRAREEIKREAAERVAKAEAEARAIREKAEREERERQEAIERTKREEEARQKDRAHRSKLMGEAKSAIMTCGADEETAKKIVLAVIAGEIPHISLRF